MSDDKVSLSKGKVLDVVKIKARRSIEKCDLGSELIFFFIQHFLKSKKQTLEKIFLHLMLEETKLFSSPYCTK